MPDITQMPLPSYHVLLWPMSCRGLYLSLLSLPLHQIISLKIVALQAHNRSLRHETCFWWMLENVSRDAIVHVVKSSVSVRYRQNSCVLDTLSSVKKNRNYSVYIYLLVKIFLFVFNPKYLCDPPIYYSNPDIITSVLRW